MKVALCIAGEPQYYNYTYENILNNLIKTNPNYQFDFFLCVYNSQSKYNIDRIIFKYQPKKFMIKSPNKIKMNNIVKFVNKGTQLDKLYEVFKLKKSYENENNFKYDLVFRLRFELVFDTPIDLSKQEIKDNTVYCIDYARNKLNSNLLYDLVHSYKNKLTKEPLHNIMLNNLNKLNDNFGIMDWFLFGTSQSMDFILTIYETLPSYTVYKKFGCISHELYLHIGILLCGYNFSNISFDNYKPYLVHLLHRKIYANQIPARFKHDISKLNHEGY